MAGRNSNLTPDLSNIPSSVVTGIPTPLSFTFPAGKNPSDFTVSWSASCGGTFSDDPAYPSDKTKTIFTSPLLTSNTDCPITLTISDACGRVFNSSKVVVITCEMQVSITSINACSGSSNGIIKMNISGSAGPYIWSWTRQGGGTGSGTGTVISGLSAGVYSVTVLSGNGTGSSKTFVATITESLPISPLVISSVNVLCNGLATGSINIGNVSGGTPPYTFLWADNVTTPNRSGLLAGTYSVVASDANNCQVTSGNITISQPSVIIVTPTITNVNCFGNASGAISLEVSGGTSPYSYTWNDGSILQNRINLTSGTYSVTVTDASSCTKTVSGIVVSQPSTALSLSATTINVSCNSGANGSIILTASGGTAPYQYNWGGGITTKDRTNLTVGNYLVTVIDANGCNATLSKVITQPIPLAISVTVVNETCPGSTDGAVTLTITGGTAGYTYAWSGPNGFTSTVVNPSGLTGGTYNLTVTDTNGCTSTTSITITDIHPTPVKPGMISK